MRRADRLFQIVQLLRRRRVTTARRLADELEVSERTIYRDVADLILSGVPIEGEAGVGYALPRGFDVPPMMFTADEIEALVLGARVVKSWGDRDLARAAAQLIAKVESVLPDTLKPRIARATLFAPGFHVPEVASAALAPLRFAIREQRKVRFAYSKPGTDASERTVRPLGLFFWGSSWSLGAWCELRRDFRSFRLDRIADARILDESFVPEPGRSLADFFAGRGANIEAFD